MPEISLGTVVGPQGPPGPKGDTGTFSPEDLQRISDLESGKVDKVSGKGLSTNDYTTADKNAVATISNKVDKVSGKGLSTNDYTTAEKNKLSGIAAEANKTLIDATLSNAGQAADAKATGDKFSAFRELLRRMEIYCTASGNPATFSDAAAANVKALSVTITPTQSGSGDPSPTNIRPISGVTSVSVTRTGQNGANSQTVTVQLTDGSNPLTVYGGTLDVTTGVLTVNRKRVLISSQTWDARTVYDNDTHFVSVTDRPILTSGGGVASCYPAYNSVWNSRRVDYGIVIASNEWSGLNSYYGHTAIRDNRFSSAADFVAAMGDQSYVIPVTPVTYQLTPQQLATLSGYNAVLTDAASVSVTYKADTSIIWGAD